MFEPAELGRTISKAEYEEEVPKLRWQLLDAQRRLRSAPFPVIILFAGVDAAGKSETVQLLTEWMDPRLIVARAFDNPSDEERERPAHWRFWRELPSKGSIALFMSAWYSAPLLDRVYGRTSATEFESALRRITDLERMLGDDGAVILKFWMHLSKAAQKRRLQRLEADPLTRWRVTKRQWKNWKRYERFVTAAEQIIRQTSVGYAPWIIVEGADAKYRGLTVGMTIRDALETALRGSEAPAAKRSDARRRSKADAARLPARTRQPEPSVLDQLDMARAISPEIFSRRLAKAQGRLAVLARHAQRKGVSSIFLFEGWDASGKGGAIRRVTAALDPPLYRIVPVAAPNDEERAHHYLWRFWRHIARAGRITIFDRSWYGRVLVERVERLATEAEWGRAYAEINQLEDQLVAHGIVLVKCWLHVTKDEQLRRFNERAKSPFKSWKLSDEDWRNRKKWDEYAAAVNDMIGHTSTRRAPWTLVEANDKYFARIKIIRTICDALEDAVERD